MKLEIKYIGILNTIILFTIICSDLALTASISNEINIAQDIYNINNPNYSTPIRTAETILHSMMAGDLEQYVLAFSGSYMADINPKIDTRTNKYSQNAFDKYESEFIKNKLESVKIEEISLVDYHNQPKIEIKFSAQENGKVRKYDYVFFFVKEGNEWKISYFNEFGIPKKKMAVYILILFAFSLCAIAIYSYLKKKSLPSND